ncbi:unnamed protein product (macronuclear) [Paramecium tetraurelia]|uniref:Ubiquitin-like domain-containing protein n=1 Tax=Paramecium tetraurelia TaxID=5888 RepID=A0BY18_PARTE|nr:uncharacterized protein GSPATT00033288001 [Paramecium tetraurelia]CAK63435.1 unnamed protein product [Paramecium tetraurelia]|eukprot:XP_001430833.1 hypothetical protein (macronuclear) [Paramecium tetraurelia strain d4-2]
MNQAITVIITFAQKNKVYNIEIDPLTKVQELINEFHEMLHPAGNEKIQLKYQGTQLRPNQTFEEQGVRKGTQIELLVETQGGL